MSRLANVAIVVGVLVASATSHSAPRVVVIQTTAFNRVPNAPENASSQLQAVFERAKDIHRFENALGRYYRRLVEDDNAARRVKLAKSSEQRLLISKLTLGTEVARQVGLATETQRPALLHLQAWNDYLIAGMVYEAKFDELDVGSTSLLPIDAIEDGPDYKSAIAALREISENFPKYRERDAAQVQYAYLLLQTDNGSLAKATALSLVCPEGLGSTANRYETCTSLDLSRNIAAYTWILIGEQHVTEPGELPLAVLAFQKALAGGGQYAPLANYLVGWAYHRQDLYDQAIASFLAVLDAGSADTVYLRKEAVTDIALSVIDQWQAQDPRPRLLDAAATRFAGQFNKDHVREIFVELRETAENMQLDSDAAALSSFVEQIWPQ
jgi:tetratricopeptide (TPR) repeat protein